MRLTFRETSVFTRQITKLVSDDELSALEWTLMANPERGDLIRGSGGLRIIYYWHVPGSVILFLLAYSKNEQSDLTIDQIKILRTLVQNEFP